MNEVEMTCSKVYNRMHILL